MLTKFYKSWAVILQIVYDSNMIAAKTYKYVNKRHSRVCCNEHFFRNIHVLKIRFRCSKRLTPKKFHYIDCPMHACMGHCIHSLYTLYSSS